MTAANLSVAVFGPVISPANSFVLIGLDLTLRDWLQIQMNAWQMGALILFAGMLTYAMNPEAGMIATASACSFSVAALVDWAAFTRLRGSWAFRANGSNVVGSAVDSLIFPTMAFGMLIPHIVALQFIAKVAGGAIWTALMTRKVG